MLGLGTAIPFNQNVGNLVAPLNPLQMSVNCGLWYDFTDLSVQTIDPSTSGISEITNKGLILFCISNNFDSFIFLVDYIISYNFY